MQTKGATVPGSEPSLVQFLEILMADGRAIVTSIPLKPLSTTADDPAIAVLHELEARSRVELPGEPPPFSEPAALWAARLFYHICQFIVCREIGEPEIQAVFAVPCPAPRGPATDWSADLLFRQLLALFRSAKHLSNADPLLDQMQMLATNWPLSSVGIAGLGEVKIETFIGHAALAGLYVDRIIAASDLSRLGESRVDELLRSALGSTLSWLLNWRRDCILRRMYPCRWGVDAIIYFAHNAREPENMECGGKRSATPLLPRNPKRRRAAFAAALHKRSGQAFITSALIRDSLRRLLQLNRNDTLEITTAWQKRSSTR